MITAYHGTKDPKIAAEILKSGFLKGTYFALRIEDAVHFGGQMVFTVKFQEDGFAGEPDGWQFHLTDSLPPSVIERIEFVSVTEKGMMRGEIRGEVEDIRDSLLGT